MITTSLFPPKKAPLFSHSIFFFLTLSKMCSKPTKGSSRKRRKGKKSKPSRKTRSLNQDLSIDSPESAESTQLQQQLNLFPLHPEIEEKEDHNVEYLFNTTDNTSSATLNGLIWSAVSSEEDSRCQSLTYAYSEEVTRSALRGGNKERDLSEEKWVCYEEVTSCVPEYFSKVKTECEGAGDQDRGLSLCLKLDYDEIMNAWSDKGPLYIDGGGGGCQIVPDVFDDDTLRQDNNNVIFEMGNVPLLGVSDDGSSAIEGIDGEIWKLGPREARVMRYKEKRRKRLFSKRIRYEVRKLNAEKRPRMKGRFVKRS